MLLDKDVWVRVRRHWHSDRDLEPQSHLGLATSRPRLRSTAQPARTRLTASGYMPHHRQWLSALA
jgi:hypothetical protein